MKPIAYFALIACLLVANMASAQELVTEDNAIVVISGGGGVDGSAGENSIASTSGQSAIAHLDDGVRTIGVGLYYLSSVFGVVGSPPAVALSVFILMVEDYGIEWVKVNWSG